MKQLSRSIRHRGNLCSLICLMMIFSSCEKMTGLDKTDSQPVDVFEDLWKTMDTKYAFFKIKNVDWNSVGETYKQLVANSMTQRELFDTMGDMLETVKDGHVTLMSPFDTVTYQHFFQGYPVNFNYDNIVKNYLFNDYNTSGPLIYKLHENVGYIYYRSFFDEISPADLDLVMNELQGAKGLIVDVRSNTGGNSANVNKLFSRFINQKRLVKYELRKSGIGHDDFADPEPFYVEPSGKTFTKPVVVLTNRTCFSACNDFVMYMSELDNVRVIGDQTGGGGSLPFNYILPNGWKLQYSATITLDPSMKEIESGIKPDEYIINTPIDVTNGKDAILERAFFYLH